MVKYQKVNIAVNGKSSKNQTFRESGSLAENPGGGGFAKVRPGAKVYLSDK